MRLSFVLNGVARTVDSPTGSSLLEVLRTDLAPSPVLSIKDGCSPQGQCGACLVLVDGSPKVSCAMPAEAIEGKSILTLEGVSERERRLLASSFARLGAIQCGFCIPGILLRAKHILDAHPDPSEDEIRRKLDVHLCRCTGYQSIVEAIRLAARAWRSSDRIADARRDGDGVGQPVVRIGAEDVALGMRPYVDDLRFPNLLHGAVRLSDHARARVIGIDTTKAARLPGVRAIATHRDVPGERWYGLLIADWPGFVAEGEITHSVGSFIAAVAADDVRIARRAAQLIDVTYEALAPLVDPERAMASDAPKIHAAGNILSRSKIVRGDVARAFEAARHVARETFSTQRIEHGYLEPESACAVPRDDATIEVFSQGQGVFDDRRQVASFLGVPEDRVLVTLVPNGGAFGGKEDMAVQPHAALLSKMTGRPVKISLTREQSIRVHPKRHPIRMDYEVACDEAGHLLAVRAHMIGDTGAHASVGAKVLERAAGHACGPYRVPNVDVEAVAVYTNNPPSGAMRGFGANQAAFAMESMVDILAERVGCDRFEMRAQNVVRVGDVLATGQILEKSVGMEKTLFAVKDRWDAAVRANKAVGIACGMKNSGIGNGAIERGLCRLVVGDDGIVSLFNGFTEMGQGLFTVLVQFACEVTGLSAERFRSAVDTRHALDCGQTTGSRATLLAGNAVVVAAKKLAHALAEAGSLEALRGASYEGEFVVSDTVSLGSEVENPKTHTTYGWATQLVILDEHGHLEEVIAAHDVGRVVNPILCKGQIEGSIHMGLGYALSEELDCGEDGMPQNGTMRGLGILRARHMPKIDVRFVEESEPEGPYGAKGVGEIGLVPTAGAVAGALHAYDGVRRTSLPMKGSAAAEVIVGKKR